MLTNETQKEREISTKNSEQIVKTFIIIAMVSTKATAAIVVFMLKITIRHWFVELQKGSIIIHIHSIRSRSFDTEACIYKKKHFPGNWYYSHRFNSSESLVTLGVNECDQYKWLENNNSNSNSNNYNNNNNKINYRE